MEEEKYDGEISEVIPRAFRRVFFFGDRSHFAVFTIYLKLYNEQCKTRVVISGAEFVIRV